MFGKGRFADKNTDIEQVESIVLSNSRKKRHNMFLTQMPGGELKSAMEKVTCFWFPTVISDTLFPNTSMRRDRIEILLDDILCSHGHKKIPPYPVISITYVTSEYFL